jgi:hypothetical protein
MSTAISKRKVKSKVKVKLVAVGLERGPLSPCESK